MPLMNFSNNTIKQFGATFPTLYFDRVELHDEKIKLKLALYVDGNEHEEDAFASYVESTLSRLKYYVMIVLDGEVSRLWNPNNMPAPYLEITSDHDFSTGTMPYNLYEAATTYDLFPTADTWVDLGLAPSGMTGDYMVLSPDYSATYEAAVPKYYPAVEADRESTNRMNDLISGNRNVFELVRRSYDYDLKATIAEGFTDAGPAKSPSDYFTAIPDSSKEEDVYQVSTRQIYHNPITDVDGKFNEISSVESFGGGYTVELTTSDPGTSNDPIGYEVVYPDNNGSACNLLEIPFSEFSTDYQKMYKPSGDVVYKISVTIEEAFVKASAPVETGAYTVEKFVSQLYRIPRFSLVAFTSAVDIPKVLSERAESTPLGWCGGGVDAPCGDVVIDALLHAPITKLNEFMTSDITYETITAFGEVPVEPFVVFREQNGALYDELPIQTLDGVYYDQSAVALEDIKNSIDSLSNAVPRPSRTDPVANQLTQDISDGIKFILAEYGDKEDLLFQLNAFRKNIPDTSSLLYEEFKKLLFVLNQRAKQGAVLRREQARPTVVVDFRRFLFPEWTERTNYDAYTTEAMTLNYINPWRTKVSKYADKYLPSTAITPTTYGNYTLDEYGDTGTGEIITAAEMNFRAINSLTELNIFINGYFFFDYERAVRETSYLSSLLDISKLDQIFGRDLVASTFQLKNSRVQLHRFTEAGQSRATYGTNLGTENEPEWALAFSAPTSAEPSSKYETGQRFPGFNADVSLDSTKLIATIDTEYDTTTQAPYVKSIKFDGTPGVPGFPHGGEASEFSLDGHNLGIVRPYVHIQYDEELTGFGAENELLNLESTEYSYCCLRNFEFADKLMINDSPYRLMAHEFQFVIPEQTVQMRVEPTYQDLLSFTVEVEDNSLEVYKYLGQKVEEEVQKIEAYTAAAAEFCSYNNIDGYFNQFFRDHQMNLFASEPASAPWVLAPLMFNYILDLLTNYYDGNLQVMFDDALVMSGKINPDTGSLDELARFTRDFKELHENYFGTDADAYATYTRIKTILDTAPSVKTRIYGHNYNTGAPEGCTVYPLPQLEEIYSQPSEYNASIDQIPADIYWKSMDPGLVKVSFGMKNMPNRVHTPMPETSVDPVETDPSTKIPYRPVVMIRASTAANTGNLFAAIRGNASDYAAAVIAGVQTTTQAIDETWYFTWFSQLQKPAATVENITFTINGMSEKTIERKHAHMTDSGWMVISSPNWYQGNYSTVSVNRNPTHMDMLEYLWLYEGVAYDVKYALMEDRSDIEGNHLEDIAVWESKPYVFKVPYVGVEGQNAQRLVDLSPAAPTRMLPGNLFTDSAAIARMTQAAHDNLLSKFGKVAEDGSLIVGSAVDNDGRHWTIEEFMQYQATVLIYDGTNVVANMDVPEGSSFMFTGEGEVGTTVTKNAFRPSETKMAEAYMKRVIDVQDYHAGNSVSEFYFTGNPLDPVNYDVAATTTDDGTYLSMSDVQPVSFYQISNPDYYQFYYNFGWDFGSSNAIESDGTYEG